MRTEYTIQFSLDVSDPRVQKVITDLVCNEAQVFLTQVTMLAQKGRVQTKVTMENNDIGTVELDPITGLDKAEQL